MLRSSKYGAVKTVVGGRTFASRKEARRYSELLLLEKAGEVRELRCQVTFPLLVRDELVCRYVADFQYEERRSTFDEWKRVIEDTKGVRTPVYVLKRKLMFAVYGIVIRET